MFAMLIGCSTQSVIADHAEPGDGIYRDYADVNLDTTRDSKWLVSLQLIIRTGDGQLINVTEGTDNAAYISHKITDHVFDNLMSEKEIVTIDNIKYEQAKHSGKPDKVINWQYVVPIYNISSHFVQGWVISLCSEFDDHGYGCITPFQATTAGVSVVEGDVVENHWTVLRIIN